MPTSRTASPNSQDTKLELWVGLTFAAAFFQNARSLLQKRLTGRLTVAGASYARFLFAVPLAWLYCAAVLTLWHTKAMPSFDWTFVGYCLVGGLAQVVATVWLLAAFQQRNFMAATALSKTETVQAAAFGLVILGDVVTLKMGLGIALSFVGVILLAGVRKGLSLDRAAALGFLAGSGFAVAAVAYRGAALSLDDGDAITRASMTLATTLTLQTVIMGAYIARREPGQITRVWQARAVGWQVGLAGVLASAGWFTAMALVSAALVRAVGQIELVLAFITSVWFLGERVSRRELVGAVLIVGGILLLI